MSDWPIRIENLSYDVGSKRILDDVNLEVAHGELVSIMGKSGCGKTTLLKLIAGLRTPSGGKIWIGDKNLLALSTKEREFLTRRIGYVFQYAALFDSLTVYENILFSVKRHKLEKNRQALDQIVKTKLEQVSLPGVEQSLPSELSGGMQKRVGLARAMATEPAILLYDEPTSGLDPVTALTIDELILATCKQQGITSLVVSHHLPSVMRISDRIAMLAEGKIVAYDTPAELQRSTNDFVREFLDAEKMAEGG